MIVPDPLEQHGAGHDLACLAHQLFEYPELARLKHDRARRRATPARLSRSIVIPPMLEARRPAACSGLRRHERIDARRELGKSERLDQIIVGSGVEPVDPVLDPAERRQQQHRHLDLGRADAPNAPTGRRAAAACGRGPQRRIPRSKACAARRRRCRRPRDYGRAHSSPRRMNSAVSLSSSAIRILIARPPLLLSRGRLCLPTCSRPPGRCARQCRFPAHCRAAGCRTNSARCRLPSHIRSR